MWVVWLHKSYSYRRCFVLQKHSTIWGNQQRAATKPVGILGVPVFQKDMVSLTPRLLCQFFVHLMSVVKLVFLRTSINIQTALHILLAAFVMQRTLDFAPDTRTSLKPSTAFAGTIVAYKDYVLAKVYNFNMYYYMVD